MSHNLEYYDKYLKYKFKYLKLKELLGGINPAPFNVVAQRATLFNMISNLLTDMIVYLVLKKYNLELSFTTLIPSEKQQIEDDINRAFLRIEKKINLRNTIYEIIKYTLDDNHTISDSGNTIDQMMYMIKMKLPKDNDANQYETNIHIGCSQLNNSPLLYHLSYSFRPSPGAAWISHHFSQENAVFNKLQNYHDSYYDDKYLINIILGISAINFGDNNNTRDTLEQILFNHHNFTLVRKFLSHLLDYINKLLYKKLLEPIDLKPIITATATATATAAAAAAAAAAERGKGL